MLTRPQKTASTKESRASVLPEPPSKRQNISYPAFANPYQLISFSEIEPEIITRVHHELSIDIQSPHSQLTELGQAALIGHLHENNEHIRRLAYLECCRSSPTWDIRQQWIRDELTKRAPEMVDSFYKPRPVYAPILPLQNIPRPQWKKNFMANPLKKTAERQRRKRGDADSPISVASTTDSSTQPVTITNGDEVTTYYEVGNTKKLIPMKLDVIQPDIRLPQSTSFVTPGFDERFGITVTVSDKPFTRDTAPAAHKKAAAKPFPKRRISIDLTDSPPQKKTGNFEVVIPHYEPSPSPGSKAKNEKSSPARSANSLGTPSSKMASTPSAKASATPSAISTPLLKSALKRTPSARASATPSVKSTPAAKSTPMKEAILIRVQHSATQSIPFRMKRTTIFSHLMDQALKKLDAEMHRGFMFQRKLLQPSSTPRDVGMQEGDVVELRWWWGKKVGLAAVTW